MATAIGVVPRPGWSVIVDHLVTRVNPDLLNEEKRKHLMRIESELKSGPDLMEDDDFSLEFGTTATTAAAAATTTILPPVMVSPATSTAAAAATAAAAPAVPAAVPAMVVAPYMSSPFTTTATLLQQPAQVPPGPAPPATAAPAAATPVHHPVAPPAPVTTTSPVTVSFSLPAPPLSVSQQQTPAKPSAAPAISTPQHQPAATTTAAAKPVTPAVAVRTTVEPMAISPPSAVTATATPVPSTAIAAAAANGSVSKRRRIEEVPPPVLQLPEPKFSSITRLLLPKDASAKRSSICRALFTNNGDAVITINEDGRLQAWRFAQGADLLNENSSFTTLTPPEIPKYLIDRKSILAPPFVVITHNDHYLIAGAGGPAVSLLQHNQKDKETINERGHIDLRETPRGASGTADSTSVVTWIEFHPKNNNLLGVGFSSGAVGIFKFGRNTTRLIEMTPHPSIVLAVTFHEEGKFVASFDRSSYVCVWYFAEISDCASESMAEPEFRFLPTPEIGERIVGISFRPKTTLLAVAGFKAITLYSITRNPTPSGSSPAISRSKTPELLKVSADFGCEIRAISFSRDGKFIHCCADKCLILLEAETLKEVGRVTTVQQCRCVHSHPSESNPQCVVGTFDGKVALVRYSLV